MVQAMRRAGLAPEIVYAFEKTALLITTFNQNLIPGKDLEDWVAAVEKYFAKRDSGGLDESREALK